MLLTMNVQNKLLTGIAFSRFYEIFYFSETTTYSFHYVTGLFARQYLSISTNSKEEDNESVQHSVWILLVN